MDQYFLLHSPLSRRHVCITDLNAFVLQKVILEHCWNKKQKKWLRKTYMHPT